MPGILKMPVVGPLTSSTYPTVVRYDPTPLDPADWNLKITLKSSQPIQFQAICDGIISTVPPGEVLGSEFTTVGLENEVRPSKVKFYLQPDPVVYSELSTNLSNTTLGNGVRWFLYEDVDTTILTAAILDKLNDPRFKTLWENNNSLPFEEAEKAFLLGQLSFHVVKGEFIGTSLLANDNLHYLNFGIFTSIGYVDPVYLFNSIPASIDGDVDADAAALDALVSTGWPYVAADGSINTLINESAVKLYPNAVLEDARARLPWVSEDAQWREIADAQKALYLERLYYHNLSPTNIPPHFQFNTDDLINPFQLEAVVEFFLFWRDPGISTTPPQIDDFATLKNVEFTSTDDIHLVLVDAFNDFRLGASPLPKPNWGTDPWVQTGNMCDLYGPLSPYPADEFNGVLFILYKGRVKDWYRWTSYSSHRWEDESQGGCETSSSMEGNLKYKFWSRASGNNPGINYGLCAWYDGTDPSVLSRRPQGTVPDIWVPGRYYFRGGTPYDNNGKTEAIFHFGLTLHDHVTAKAQETSHRYNGSGGCIVSPSFYKLRKELTHWYLDQNPSIDAKKKGLLQKIQNTTQHPRSRDLWSDPEKDALFQAWGSDENKASGYIITGTFWLIHPDEPTQK